MRAVLALLLLTASTLAGADVFRPAYLEITEQPEQTYEVFWKVPSLGGGTRLSAYVQFPDTAEVTREPRVMEIGGAWNERWQVRVPGGLVGHEVAIVGKAVGVTDVIARVVRLDGSAQVERLPIGRPVFTVKPPTGHGEVAWSYLVLGIEHILGGIDHLLFVLALLLIVHGGRRILATVTAFTVAHSITLVGATLGWMHVPGPPVEAIIALSIAFVAMEILHGLDGRPGLTARAPWIVAFSFGLLHGFGFAGALEEVGLPQTAIPTALLMFNVGVEVGQLIFVGAFLALRVTWERALRLPSPQWLARTVSYGIGSVAMYWVIERVLGFAA
ncbi:MAG: HupE/UreJ family protein [Xanthomonadales bacterium]